MKDGSLIAIDRARPSSWRWNIEAVISRIGGCESAVVVGWDGVAYLPVALRCGVRICPVCFAARSGRAVHRWGPVVEQALSDGAEIWHVTLTQRTIEAFGGAVLAHERGRWAGPQPQPDRILPAVGGEGAADAYERWRGTWRTIRTSRFGRTLWKDVAALTGVEWTLRKKGRGAPRQQIPRWHCHGHVLCIADPKLSGWTPEAIMREWSRTNGTTCRQWTYGTSKRGNRTITSGGQHAERVTDRQGLVEVLKYPFKPGDLTAAGLLDAWAALRGSRTHQVCGPLHGQSRAARESPWSGWLAAAEEEAAPVAIVEWNSPGGWQMLSHRLATGPNYVELRYKLSDGSYKQWFGDPQPIAAVAAGHPAVSLVVASGGEETGLLA